LLCVSLSSNDYVGHSYGPHSHEVMDMTLHTDRQLAGFFTYLGETLGLDNCLIILTSDHGVGPVPELLRAKNGRLDRSPSCSARRTDVSRRNVWTVQPSGRPQGRL
ncbi:MAG: type phosphodiesterase/nucleotide pyrophosphatase, partial [Bacteroidetes bacterium]|nr:type phosphodiesterase/nucleotide pyrophosphatase [Bacteroidota bacterium]